MKIVEREGDKILVMGKVTLDNLSDFCRSIKTALKENDVVSISFKKVILLFLFSPGINLILWLLFIKSVASNYLGLQRN